MKIERDTFLLWLDDYCAGTLSPAERQAMDAYLEAHPEDQGEVRRQEALRGVFDLLPRPGAPAELRAAVLAGLRERPGATAAAGESQAAPGAEEPAGEGATVVEAQPPRGTRPAAGARPRRKSVAARLLPLAAALVVAVSAWQLYHQARRNAEITQPSMNQYSEEDQLMAAQDQPGAPANRREAIAQGRPPAPMAGTDKTDKEASAFAGKAESLPAEGARTSDLDFLADSKSRAAGTAILPRTAGRAGESQVQPEEKLVSPPPSTISPNVEDALEAKYGETRKALPSLELKQTQQNMSNLSAEGMRREMKVKEGVSPLSTPVGGLVTHQPMEGVMSKDFSNLSATEQAAVPAEQAPAPASGISRGSVAFYDLSAAPSQPGRSGTTQSEAGGVGQGGHAVRPFQSPQLSAGLPHAPEEMSGRTIQGEESSRERMAAVGQEGTAPISAASSGMASVPGVTAPASPPALPASASASASSPASAAAPSTSAGAFAASSSAPASSAQAPPLAGAPAAPGASAFSPAPASAAPPSTFDQAQVGEHPARAMAKVPGSPPPLAAYGRAVQSPSAGTEAGDALLKPSATGGPLGSLFSGESLAQPLDTLQGAVRVQGGQVRETVAGAIPRVRAVFPTTGALDRLVSALESKGWRLEPPPSALSSSFAERTDTSGAAAGTATTPTLHLGLQAARFAIRTGVPAMVTLLPPGGGRIVLEARLQP